MAIKEVSRVLYSRNLHQNVKKIEQANERLTSAMVNFSQELGLGVKGSANSNVSTHAQHSLYSLSLE
eukprot:4941573-Amphidinium_carterae.1